MSEQLAPANSPEPATKVSGRSRFMNHEHAGLDSVTRKYRTPDGTIYVTYAASSDDVWIDCTVGKGGTALQASAHALAALAGTALRNGTPIDKVAYCLRGVTHERSSRFGNDALSVPDALGLAIQQGA